LLILNNWFFIIIDSFVEMIWKGFRVLDVGYYGRKAIEDDMFVVK